MALPKGAFPKDFCFSPNDALSNEHARRERTTCLYKAVSMGCLMSHESTFYVEGQNYCSIVRARVLAVSDRTAYMENDLCIPIKNICKIVV